MSGEDFIVGYDEAKDVDFTSIAFVSDSIQRKIDMHHDFIMERMGIFWFGRNHQKSIKRKRIIKKWKNRAIKMTRSKVNKVVFREINYEVNN